MRPFAVEEVELHGTTLIEASAGTGKTHAITTLFVRLLLERQLEVDRILVVTFTVAATAELRQRLRRRLHEAAAAFAAGDPAAIDDRDLRVLVERSQDPAADRRRLLQAVRDVDQAAITTIHGFCHRVLRECAFESGMLFETDILIDPRPLREEVVADWFVKVLHAEPVASLRGLMAAGLSLARCRQLVDKALQHPDAGLLPVRSAPDRQPAHAAFAAAVAAARACWDEAAIVKVLSAPGLKRNFYPLGQIPGWCAAISACLDVAVQSPADLPEKLTKFRSDALAARTADGKTTPRHEFFDACQTLLDSADRLLAAERQQWNDLQHDLVAYARHELPARMVAAGRLSYDDLLRGVREALRGPSGAALAQAVRARLPVALIDEFQDTDPLQFEIFERLFTDRRSALLLVGDPKQAIYSFRGADVFAYLQVARAVPATQRHTLPTNHRSDRGMVAAVNCLFANRPDAFVLEGIAYPRVEAAATATDAFAAPAPFGAASLEILTLEASPETPIWTSHALDDRLPGLVAGEIAALLRSGATVNGRRVAPRDLAVLTRKNNQAFAVQRELRALRVPSVVLSEQSVFEAPEAEELQRLLAAIADPGDTRALRAALVTQMLGLDAAALADLERQDGEFEGWVRDFRQWRDLWVGKGFVQMLQQVLAQRQVQRRLLALVDGERRLTDLLHLGELLHQAALEQHLGPAGVLEWLARQRADTRLGPEAAQIRLESDAEAVRIATVHRSKGLEYGIVYCAYVVEPLPIVTHGKKRQEVIVFHDPEAEGRVALHIDAEDPRREAVEAQARHEQVAEAVRLLYVALTRARHRATLFIAAVKDLTTSPLARLLSAPGFDLVEPNQIQPALAALVTAGAGCIQARTLPWASAGEPLPAEPAGALELRCRVPSQPIARGLRTASFSQLTAAAAHDAGEGRERDEVLAAAPLLPATAPGLAGFPGGTRAGNFFHELLEHLDFAADHAVIAAAVGPLLAAHGYPVDPWREPVTQAVLDVLSTPLGPAGDLCLADVPRDQRLNELEFWTPVTPYLTPKALAKVFADHRSAAVAPDYAARLAALPFAELAGFVKGYIDLLFEHEGRWFVVDWKTSWLGPNRDDYAEDALRAAMARSHYVLQYHLYALAVERYLRQRVTGYQRERHFGGVLYLFLRGMTKDNGGATGVFHECPPARRMAALEQLWSEGAAER